MHFEINDQTVLRDIQKTFSNFYPFLSLSFYKIPHKKYESSSREKPIDLNKKIGELKKTHISCVIEIQPGYSVTEVEKEFQDRIGLSIQILKKEKNGWEETTGLDNLSIKDLNILGRNASDEFIVEDYNESFEAEAEVE